MWVPLLLVLCAIALLINLCPCRKCSNLFNFCSEVFENSKKPIYEAFKLLHVCAYCISYKMLNNVECNVESYHRKIKYDNC